MGNKNYQKRNYKSKERLKTKGEEVKVAMGKGGKFGNTKIPVRKEEEFEKERNCR